jgi:hypothetical protein
MHLITGDETGLVRLISTEKKEFVTYGDSQSRTLSVLSMAWLVYDESFALLRVNGHLETYHINLDDPENAMLELVGSFSSGLESPVKITRLDDVSVLCYNAKGEVNVASLSEKSGYLHEELNLFSGQNSLRGPVNALVYNSASSRLACGGQKNDLQVHTDDESTCLVTKAVAVVEVEVGVGVAAVVVTSILIILTVVLIV